MNLALEELIQKRSAIVMQIFQLNVLYGDEFLRNNMKVGLVQMSSLVGANQHPMGEVKQASLEEAMAQFEQQLTENENEIRQIMSSM